MPSTATWVSSALAVGALSYLVYFDYQRRNSPEFRKQLKRKAKKHQKAQEQAAEKGKKEVQEKIRVLINESLTKDPLPEGLQEREKVFVAEVSRADELVNQGEPVEAALAFYRALLIYPSPVDLLNIYDKSLKPEVLEILRTMIVLEPPPAIAAQLSSMASGAGAAASQPEPDLSVE